MGSLSSKLGKNMFTVNKKPLLVVLGATGAGKSKLALEIAALMEGEIINADAMQMYKGLDIVTNKVTQEELSSCPHHLIGFLSPWQEFTVIDFQQKALQIIDDVHDRGKLPVLVGGTNYYVECILWDMLIGRKEDDADLVKSNNMELRKDLDGLTATELHNRLREVDPSLAATVHPNDKRKLIRGLEVCLQTGKPLSELVSLQRQQNGGSRFGGPLRFPDACVLLVQCEPEVLHERIDKRVDKMLSRGLLKELTDFHIEFNKERLNDGIEADYEHGIFQSIGFKEFHDYLTNTTGTETEKRNLLDCGVDKMKLSTWQYAKYQTKWIRKRIVNRSHTVPVYPLDGTDPSTWEETVLQPALKLLFSRYSNYPFISRLKFAFEKEVSCPEPLPKHRQENETESTDGRILKACHICGGKLIRSSLWDQHVKSKSHKHLYGKWIKQQEGTVQLLSAREKQLEIVERDEEIKPQNESELFSENDLTMFCESASNSDITEVINIVKTQS